MQEIIGEKIPFQTVPNDPMNVLAYTLKNGLSLYLSVNPHEPRIYTNIVFRAGSKLDPPETTGLAHYMEHMLFKGSSRIGALDWEQEEKYLQRLSDLFEQHRATTHPQERQEIYRKIDRLSSEAARLAAPNEYDKLVASIGASGTNAYTWLDQTVYVNEIPSNELERWMALESERFRMLALRLFHTELETVYEEFNISQDRDFRKVNQGLRELLFPSHPYGTQTTLGSAEHLRNPSMLHIQRFFETYYVPNNMALVMAGDFNPEEVVQLAERYFEQLPAREIPAFQSPEQPPLQGPLRREVLGQEAPYVQLAWRLGKSAGEDALMADLLQQILFNEQAGLLDIELNQKQQVLESEAWTWSYSDFSVFGLYGKARQGQSLEEVEKLVLEQLDKVRRGEIEPWLLEAVINQMRVSDMEAGESNQARVSAITNMFVLGIDWERFVHRIDWMAAVGREQLSEWTRRHLRDDNYAVIYKRQGKDPNIIQVEKPPITPVELNRGAMSPFAQAFLTQPSTRIAPQFADFENEIRSLPLSEGIHLDHIKNPDNSLFRVDFIFEMGKVHDRHLNIAFSYLPYLGTRRYPAAAFQQELFRLGLSLDVQTGDDRCYLTLQGLDASLEKGLALLEHLLADVQPDPHALRNVVSDILTKRSHAKTDRNFILRTAMAQHAKFGRHSPFHFRLSETELQALQPEMLLERIQQLKRFPHKIAYYGPRPVEQVAKLVNRINVHQQPLLPLPLPTAFEQLPTESNRVLLLDFPIVQTDVLLISRGTPYFSLEEHLMRELYNDYFGSGLSSIVFQEIREARALAYSTYAVFTSPNRRRHAHYLQAYVGTQPDKLSIALPAMVDIINNMPVIEKQVEHARQSILRQIETERIIPRKIYWAARGVQDLGFRHDLRRDLYETLQTNALDKLIRFQEQYVRNRNFSFLVLGSKNQIDQKLLEQYGPVEELTMEEVFGY